MALGRYKNLEQNGTELEAFFHLHSARRCHCTVAINLRLRETNFVAALRLAVYLFAMRIAEQYVGASR